MSVIYLLDEGYKHIKRLYEKQGPQKLSSLKLFKIQNPKSIPGFSPQHLSEIYSLSNSGLQKCKERPNRSTNRDIDEIAKCPVSE